jgi:hypothetical protein
MARHDTLLGCEINPAYGDTQDLLNQFSIDAGNLGPVVATPIAHTKKTGDA